MIPSRSLSLLVAVLFALPILTGCQHSTGVRVLTQADNGSTVTLRHHDRLKIQLPGNPSTGYAWQTIKVNSWVVAPVGHPTFVSESRQTNSAPVIGAGGVVQLTYEVVGKGSTPLELGYSRPWEPESTPSQTFKLTVNVSE